MSGIKEKPAVRRHSSENDSGGGGGDWDMASDVFVSCYDDPAAELDPAPRPALDRHLPLLRGEHRLSQDGLMLGLVEEGRYAGYRPHPDPGSDYLDVDPDYTESDGNVAAKKRNRSNSSRHRGEVVTELGPEEVRWFYKEDKRTWKPFVGHDSLKVEVAYRRFCELNPDKVRRRVPSARADDPPGSDGVAEGGPGQTEPAVQGGGGGGERVSVSEERDVDGVSISVEAVCVRGGLYEVDIKEKECYPVYWNQQDRIPVMRGQWFIDGTWLPLEEDESDQIELEHLACFRGQQMRDTYETEVVTATVDSKDAIHSLKLSRSHVDWHSVDEVYLYSDATTSKIARTVSQKLGFSKDTVDSITPDKVRGLRDMLNSSAMDIMYYTSPLYRDEITRGLTHELNRLYTLFCSRNPEFEENGKVSIVSHSLGCVITFDIMTGWDPAHFHHQEEPNPEETKHHWPSHEEHHLQEQLRQTRLRLRDLEDQFQGLQTSTSGAMPALKFKVENFFCMGSPLAVFLALRGIRPCNNGVQDHILPKSICQRLFNIFHPTDPVAYRLEPLILKHYSNIAPVQIHWCNTTSPTRYDQIRPTLLNPLKESASVSDSESLPSPCTSPPQARRHYGESITSLGKASIMGAANLGKGIGGMFFSRFSRSSGHVGGVEEEPSDSDGGASEVENAGSGEEGAAAEGEEKEKQREEDTEEIEPVMSQSTSAIMDSTSLELERRIDFELREGLVESRYWSAVTSHTAYWCSHDVALFLLTFMYRQQDPPETAEDNPESS
ncbi:phospholipase DDHD1b [Lampris incognitus]|uniref:phospholipase DDHD1b n=1 Tax=Lampris incognitus TaxID=2546036 RepID=UPI0024B4DC07|nr:phospholipase DDHD1b [Lampris incognitus]